MAEIAIPDRRKWLLRLIYVRLAVFTIFVAAEVIRARSRDVEPSVDMLVLLAALAKVEGNADFCA